MFSNFKDTFIRKPQFTMKIPDAVLKTIGKELPEGFRYIDDHDGFCRLDCDGVMNIAPANVVLPDEAIPLFKEMGKFTMREVMAYVYNAQKSIELIPDEDGCYLVNGKKIKSSDFVISPLNNTRLEGGRMFVTAPPFPPPFSIKLAGNGYSMTLMVQRQPINSIDKIKIASIDNAALGITYTLALKGERKEIQFNLQTKESGLAADILASKEIFNAFILGTGTLDGKKITPNEDNQEKKVPNEVLRFWHRVVEIEKALHVTFDVSGEITLDDVKIIDQLYRCFVKKEPFKTSIKDCTLRGTGVFTEKDFNGKDISTGKEILFEYTEGIAIEVFGVTIQGYALVGIFGCVISEIEVPRDRESGEFFIKLLPAKENQMYSSTQYYTDKEGIEVVRTNQEHVKIFQAAKELENY